MAADIPATMAAMQLAGHGGIEMRGYDGAGTGADRVVPTLNPHPWLKPVK